MPSPPHTPLVQLQGKIHRHQSRRRHSYKQYRRCNPLLQIHHRCRRRPHRSSNCRRNRNRQQDRCHHSRKRRRQCRHHRIRRTSNCKQDHRHQSRRLQAIVGATVIVCRRRRSNNSYTPLPPQSQAPSPSPPHTTLVGASKNRYYRRCNPLLQIHHRCRRRPHRSSNCRRNRNRQQDRCRRSRKHHQGYPLHHIHHTRLIASKIHRRLLRRRHSYTR